MLWDKCLCGSLSNVNTMKEKIGGIHKVQACFWYVHYGGRIMIENIFVGVLVMIVLAAGIWAWWIDNRGSFRKDKDEDSSEK